MMQKIIDDREMLDFNLGNLVAEFQIDVSYLCPGDIDEAEYELFSNQ